MDTVPPSSAGASSGPAPDQGAGPGAEPGLDADVIVIGSGFGGSVAALRLVEKGYRVLVLEQGRRFPPQDLPATSWRLRRYLWAPRLGCHGFQRITKLGRVLVLAGAAVGGGSVVYANTLYRPLDAFYTDPAWRDVTDWRAELAPYYDQAERMLGVVENPTTTYVDEVYRSVAEDMGVGHTFRRTPVGVFFGRDGRSEPGVEVDDPYFGGAGPTRTGCRECGECMTGCRWNAKNTLDHNYLYLAERLGAVVVPDTRVIAVEPVADSGPAAGNAGAAHPGGGDAGGAHPGAAHPGGGDAGGAHPGGGDAGGAHPGGGDAGVGGGYRVTSIRAGGGRRAGRRVWRARQVILAGGALGTQRLLFDMRADGRLPRLSPRLGELTRTNSESLIGATRTRPDERLTRGVAITSSFYPDPDTHIEPVRYGRGSNVMSALSTLMTDGGGRVPRWLRYLGQVLRHPLLALFAPVPWRWSERTMISLVMQSRDNSLTVHRRRGPFGTAWLTSRQGSGEPNPSWIPAGNEATRRVAEKIGGFPGSTVLEMADIPLTAHILGGATIGATAADGVIDAYHRVFGHPGLHVVDGSAVTANLGVNPSLTITAQAERALSFWPVRGGVDPRPPLGSPYRRVEPVAPARPAVPAGAPAAYRIGGLPVIRVDGSVQPASVPD